MERRAILDTVKQKIDAAYRSRLGQWEEEFYQDDVGFLEHLHDVCVAQIVHDNLMKCGDRYDAGYLAALAEERTPSICWPKPMRMAGSLPPPPTHSRPWMP